jgi:chorismate mutase
MTVTELDRVMESGSGGIGVSPLQPDGRNNHAVKARQTARGGNMINGDMIDASNGNGGPSGIAKAHVSEVVRSAERELRQLLRQRAEIMKRIGTLKQTLAGLANLFGESVLTDELVTLLERGAAKRRSGLTRACRLVLMDSSSPVGAREVCEQLQRRFPGLLEGHKDPLASVNTILSRLVDYSEARSLLQHGGRRVWEWITDRTSSGAAAESRLVEDAAVRPD